MTTRIGVAGLGLGFTRGFPGGNGRVAGFLCPRRPFCGGQFGPRFRPAELSAFGALLPKIIQHVRRNFLPEVRRDVRRGFLCHVCILTRVTFFCLVS